MITRVTRPQLKKLIKEQGSIYVHIGNIRNGIFWHGCYISEVSSIEEVDQALVYAKNNGWRGKLYFGVSGSNI